jgi:hypothetical protein
MRRLLVLAGFLAIFTLPARAQITPRYEVGGGFDYTRFGPQTLTATTSTFTLNTFGWNVNGVYNLRRHYGVAFDVSGVYNIQTSASPNIGNATTQVYPFLIGPRIYPLGHRKLTLFGQVLVGGAVQRLGAPTLVPFPATVLTSTGYAWQGGGGVDYTFRDHWAIRMIEVDYLNTFLNGNSSGSERATVGVTYRWGVAAVRRKKK